MRFAHLSESYMKVSLTRKLNLPAWPPCHLLLKRTHPLSRYPRGWLAIARPDELPVGAARPVDFMGKEVVLLRTESGRPYVFNAYCIRLDALLGHGGVV